MSPLSRKTTFPPVHGENVVPSSCAQPQVNCGRIQQYSIARPAVPRKRGVADGLGFVGSNQHQELLALRFTVVPESESGLADPLGVICHEYGHQLGLPDLYDTSTGLATIGTWDLMDYPWAGTQQGSNPPHLGAWCKKFLGFGVVQPSSTGTVTFFPVETNNTGVHELYATGQEYFLAEYRSKTAGTFDAALPQAAGGLALWHVDDAVALNGTVL